MSRNPLKSSLIFAAAISFSIPFGALSAKAEEVFNKIEEYNRLLEIRNSFEVKVSDSEEILEEYVIYAAHPITCSDLTDEEKKEAQFEIIDKGNSLQEYLRRFGSETKVFGIGWYTSKIREVNCEKAPLGSENFNHFIESVAIRGSLNSLIIKKHNELGNAIMEANSVRLDRILKPEGMALFVDWLSDPRAFPITEGDTPD